MTSKKRPGRNPGSRSLEEMPNGPGKDMLLAANEMVWRTGATKFQLRYSDDEQPVVWMAVGQWGDIHEVGASLDPVRAAIRLLEQVVDGGQCIHCHRPTGITDDFDAMPLNERVCWYQYDPELKTFRRGCKE
jgi:hypothetical protein